MKKGGNIFNLNTNIRDMPCTKSNLKNMTWDEASMNIGESEISIKQAQNAQNLLSTKEYFHNKKMQLYKTEICRSHSEIGYCKYGNKCQFAHDIKELRNVNRHPRYKTETCRTFWEEGSCPYGKRCCFIHIKNKFMDNSNIELGSINSESDTLKKELLLGSPQSVDGKNLSIYKDDVSNVNNTIFNEIDNNDEFDFDQGMFNSIEQTVNKTHTQTISDISSEDEIFIKDVQVINFEKYDNHQSSTENIHFEVPADYSCKDYELDRPIPVQREWSDKFIKLSPEDSIFINSLFVTERRPFWESSDTSLWSTKSLFYVNMNNHKWK